MIAEALRAFKHRLRTRRALAEIAGRRIVSPAAHGLGAELIVSLTSYAARFPTLVPTLHSLLRQDMRADRTILWLTEADRALLPPGIAALTAEGLEIRTTPDLRSYKKIVPALLAFPQAFIATADDDVPYPAHWLSDMVRVAQAHPGCTVAHRAHRLGWAGDGTLTPYESWEKNIDGTVKGPEIFATGVGGVLYPPGILHPDATRDDLFMTLCPNADDIWLYWMTRRAGHVACHVGPKVRVIEWPRSQGGSLRLTNLGTAGQNGNDRAIAALTAHYGPPPR